MLLEKLNFDKAVVLSYVAKCMDAEGNAYHKRLEHRRRRHALAMEAAVEFAQKHICIRKATADVMELTTALNEVVGEFATVESFRESAVVRRGYVVGVVPCGVPL